MAVKSVDTEVNAREVEVEQARVRLARTLEKLTSPETQEAVKAEVLAHATTRRSPLFGR